MPSKLDKEIESGEYFMKEHERKAKKMAEKLEKQRMAKNKRKAERDAEYVAPDEDESPKKSKKEKKAKKEKKSKKDSSDSKKFVTDVSLDDLKNKFLKKSSGADQSETKGASVSDFVMTKKSKKSKKS